MKGIQFRQDLQGLRAIAVIVVILAHASVNGFTGGFVGVDLFFVLSGYLITAGLYQEYLTTGRISIGQFYSRRIKRLLPALVLVMIFTLVAAFLLMSPMQAKSQVGSTPFVGLWFANFYFTFTEFDYFNELATNDLFLHTWSLGVEEQFYLLWPLTLLLCFKLATRNTQSNSTSSSINHYRLLIAIAAIGCASFALGLYWINTKPIWAFYQMPGRIWQFCLGAAAYIASQLFMSVPTRTQTQQLSAGVLLTAGVVGIIYAVTTYNQTTIYPGIAAIIPSASAALIIFGGVGLAPSRNPLCVAPLQWIGNRSYSAYLWHWPVLMLPKSIGIELDAASLTAAILGTLLLSDMTYRLIEKPFWKGPLAEFSAKQILTAGLLTMLLLLAGGFHLTRKSVTAKPTDIVSLVNRWQTDVPVIYSMPCDTWYRSAEVSPCMFGKENAKKTLLMMGDSIGVQWFSLFALAAQEADWRMILLTKSSCPMVDESIYYSRIKQNYLICDQWRHDVLARVSEWNPDLIVLGSAASYDFSDQQWSEGSQRIWQKLTQNNTRLLVVAGTPILGINGPQCIAKHLQNGVSDLTGLCQKDQSASKAYHVALTLQQAAAGIPLVDIIDFNALVCPQQQCRSISKSGIITFRDDKHLTDSYVHWIYQQKKKEIKQYFQ